MDDPLTHNENSGIFGVLSLRIGILGPFLGGWGGVRFLPRFS